MTYIVSSGALNSTHSLTQSVHKWSHIEKKLCLFTITTLRQQFFVTRLIHHGLHHDFQSLLLKLCYADLCNTRR